MIFPFQHCIRDFAAMFGDTGGYVSYRHSVDKKDCFESWSITYSAILAPINHQSTTNQPIIFTMIPSDPPNCQWIPGLPGEAARIPVAARVFLQAVKKKMCNLHWSNYLLGTLIEFPAFNLSLIVHLRNGDSDCRDLKLSRLAATIKIRESDCSDDGGSFQILESTWKKNTNIAALDTSYH